MFFVGVERWKKGSQRTLYNEGQSLGKQSSTVSSVENGCNNYDSFELGTLCFSQSIFVIDVIEPGSISLLMRGYNKERAALQRREKKNPDKKKRALFFDPPVLPHFLGYHFRLQPSSHLKISNTTDAVIADPCWMNSFCPGKHPIVWGLGLYRAKQGSIFSTAMSTRQGRGSFQHDRASHVSNSSYRRAAISAYHRATEETLHLLVQSFAFLMNKQPRPRTLTCLQVIPLRKHL